MDIPYENRSQVEYTEEIRRFDEETLLLEYDTINHILNYENMSDWLKAEINKRYEIIINEYLFRSHNKP